MPRTAKYDKDKLKEQSASKFVTSSFAAHSKNTMTYKQNIDFNNQ